MRVAFVHDWLTGMRGGEFVLKELIEIFPDSEIFTLLYIKGKLDPLIEEKKIHTSFIQSLPFAAKYYRHYLPLFPAAVEEFRFDGFDLIFSTSHCVAKGAIAPAGVPHICYCHTPMRYAWDLYHDYFGNYRGLRRLFVSWVISRLRTWDVASAVRVDRFLANSNLVKERIRRYYRREAEVIHPPIDTEFFRCSRRRGDYFLAVSSHVPYKKIDLLLEVFSRLRDYSLIILGDGPLFNKHLKRASENVRFIKRVSKEELRELYCNASALIHPSKEDFGMVMAEAQSCGVPVIAYGEGGALDIVTRDTGILFRPQSPEALVEAIGKFRPGDFDPERIRKNSLRFSRERFRDKILRVVKEVTG